MSDTFVSCLKCGNDALLLICEETEETEMVYYCSNCGEIKGKEDLKIQVEEYLKGGEDEEINQSRRSKE